MYGMIWYSVVIWCSMVWCGVSVVWCVVVWCVMEYKRVRAWLMKLRQRGQLIEILLLKNVQLHRKRQNQFDNSDMLCKYFPFYRARKQSISKDMNKDNLKYT